MTGAKYCSVHSTTSAATNTISTTLDGTCNVSTYFDETQVQYSLGDALASVFSVSSFSQPNSSGY